MTVQNDIGLLIDGYDRTGGQYVVNRGQVGEHNIWIDPRMNSFKRPFISEVFKQAMADAGASGIGYHELPTA